MHHKMAWEQVSDRTIYSSRALSETEKGYAQIEKELAAVVFGCTRFHQYIFGKRIIVESDHKPFTSIYNKLLVNCPLRSQQINFRFMILKLSIKKGQN